MIRYLALLGAIAPTAVAFLYPDGGFLFHPDRWARSKTSRIIEFQGFLFSAGLAIIPALLVVRSYRERFREDGEHVA